MLSLSLDTLSKVSKTTSPQKLFTYYCVTLYVFVKNKICRTAPSPEIFAVQLILLYTSLELGSIYRFKVQYDSTYLYKF